MFNFSLARLFLATTSFAVVFAALVGLGDNGMVASIIGAIVACVCLTAQPKNIRSNVQLGIVVIVGATVGLALMLTIAPPYGGGHFGFLLLAITAGAIVGLYRALMRNKRSRTAQVNDKKGLDDEYRSEL